MSFGGAVKLTGESAYRRALQQITQNLREVSSEMKVVSSAFDRNDRSVDALRAKEDVLNRTLAEQTNKLNVLKSQYASMSAQYATQTAKHNALVQSYNSEKAKLDEIGRTLGTTSREYQDQKAKVEQLADAVRKSSANQDANARSMSKMRTEINGAQAECNKTARELDNLGREAADTGREAEQAGDGFTVFKGVLADLASRAIAAAIDALKRLATSLVNVGRSAFAQYGEFQQMTGGVETLFGESADTVREYAQNAYRTAGLSANDYMNQVVMFSATLLQGLEGDTVRAADVADMAIRDMSDNANKMGTDISMIQNAYQGFARDTYTMLDNLRLGYSGSASEMARLVNDSGVLGDAVTVTAQTVKDVPFDKIIEAIHIIQQQIGITGTTAEEASGTITGSMAQMKAAWENLLVAVADPNQDVGAAVERFTETITTALQNAIPTIGSIIEGIGQLLSSIWNDVIPEIAASISEQVPMLEPLMDIFMWLHDHGNVIIGIIAGIAGAFLAFRAVNFITTLVTGIMGVISAVQMGIPVITALGIAWNATGIGLVITLIAGLVTAFITLWHTSDGFRNFWINLWNGIKNVVGTIVGAIVSFFTEVIPAAFNYLKDRVIAIKDAIVGFFLSIPEKVGEFVNAVVEWFRQLPYRIGEVIGELIGRVIRFWAEAVNWVRTRVPEIIQNIVNFFKELPSKIWQWLVNTITRVAQWGVEMRQRAREAALNFITNVIEFIKQLPHRIWEWLVNTIQRVVQFREELAQRAREAASNLVHNIVNGIASLPSRMLEIGRNIVQGLWNGISNMIQWVRNKISGFVHGIFNGIRNALGIHSPSTLFRDQVGKYMAQGLALGFTDEMDNVSKQMQDSIPTSFDTDVVAEMSPVNRASQVIADMASAVKDGIGNVFNFDITINTAEGQNPREIADEIMQRIQYEVSRKGAVYG